MSTILMRRVLININFKIQCQFTYYSTSLFSLWIIDLLFLLSKSSYNKRFVIYSHFNLFAKSSEKRDRLADLYTSRKVWKKNFGLLVITENRLSTTGIFSSWWKNIFRGTQIHTLLNVRNKRKSRINYCTFFHFSHSRNRRLLHVRKFMLFSLIWVENLFSYAIKENILFFSLKLCAKFFTISFLKYCTCCC